MWALCDFGFRAVIAPSFGDIFQSNALKNGLLPVVLPARCRRRSVGCAARASPGRIVDVDLVAQTVTMPDVSVHEFDIDPFSRHCLLQGLDELDYTLTHRAIEAHISGQFAQPERFEDR